MGNVSLDLLTYQKKWVILLLLGFMNSLYILETSPLSDIHFAEIFSQAVSCHFTLHTSFDRAEKFNFNESLSYCFFFQGEYFAVIFSHHQI